MSHGYPQVKAVKFVVQCSTGAEWNAPTEGAGRLAVARLNDSHHLECKPHRLIQRLYLEVDVTDRQAMPMQNLMQVIRQSVSVALNWINGGRMESAKRELEILLEEGPLRDD